MVDSCELANRRRGFVHTRSQALTHRADKPCWRPTRSDRGEGAQSSPRLLTPPSRSAFTQALDRSGTCASGVLPVGPTSQLRPRTGRADRSVCLCEGCGGVVLIYI